MKLEMEAPPLPPSFPFPSRLPLSFSPWGLGNTQDNAQSWVTKGRLTAGQSSREVANWGLKLLPWEAAAHSCWTWQSQDEAMSDGRNHAGRSAGQTVVRAGLGRGLRPPRPSV